ncbi:hypothetical protein TWF694_001482 [Orbilia ellipsospora]|uniref:endo-polygalacturonase n=1 Tax=Orbilia ellipsospora TaxID=2528407 RepID=A0AAV9XSK0_9PEZI
MVFLSKFTAALLLCATALAAPAPEPTAAPNLDHALAKRATTCTFTGSSGYLSASASKTSCSTIIISALSVPSGVTLNLEKLNEGTTVIFRGHTTFGYAEWEGSLVSISGKKIKILGDSGSVLDGQGALYWDGLGGSGGKIKPKFFKANNLNDSIIDGITILNAPKNSFSLNKVYNLTVQNILIDDRAGDALGKNTDGFNIGNVDGVYLNHLTVYNQDDCMNVNSGQNILMTNSVCTGGHGLSIGSVADGAVVRNVTYDTITMNRSQQSVRIKTNSGAVASVSDITYRNIKIVGAGGPSSYVDYGIIVDQTYGGTKNVPTNGVLINNFVLTNVTGTVPSDAINVQIQCGVGSCTNFHWTNVKVTGGKTSTNCMNVPAGISC